VNMAPSQGLSSRLWSLAHRIDPAWTGGCRGVEVAPAVQRAGFVDMTRDLVTQLSFRSEVLLAWRPAASQAQERER
jgi:hypothetical protein